MNKSQKIIVNKHLNEALLKEGKISFPFAAYGISSPFVVIIPETKTEILVNKKNSKCTYDSKADELVFTGVVLKSKTFDLKAQIENPVTDGSYSAESAPVGVFARCTIKDVRKKFEGLENFAKEYIKKYKG